MTPALHEALAVGRWQGMSLVEQLANIGSEVGRATKAKSLDNEQRLTAALERCLELFDLTLADERWRGRRREIARGREIVCDFLVGDNTYGSTPRIPGRLLPSVCRGRSTDARRLETLGVGAYVIDQDGGVKPFITIEEVDAGRLSRDRATDRALVRRLLDLSDAQREAHFVSSNRAALEMLADARRAG